MHEKVVCMCIYKKEELEEKYKEKRRLSGTHISGTAGVISFKYVNLVEIGAYCLSYDRLKLAT